ncbi:MAG: ATP-binding protein [Candidatus Latescibacteria bacterium]|nr:ATP-binding protein [Candidatus Latescibacterota bacterium]
MPRLLFLDREREIRRLLSALAGDVPGLAVVYGRRRCGKSTLLQHIVRPHDVYYVADQRDAVLQIQSVAGEIARDIPGFDQVTYPSWSALLETWNARAARGRCLMLDEFPYLVQMAPELPSVLQKFVDDRRTRVHLILCGSSQRMMQGIVLDAAAPLYGRAREIVPVRPLEAGWIQEALGIQDTQAVEAYAVWGGVPRYWELARSYPSLAEAIRTLILERDSILHHEPERLLLDDLRSATQAHSLLSLIGQGCHRLSEIAGRLSKPAGHLGRPLAHLLELGYVTRDIPYGETIKSTKRSFYRLADPFLMFWYRYVQPNRSLLEQGLQETVYTEMMKTFPQHVAAVWEDLARASTARFELGGTRWKPAQRWWGRGHDGRPMELDLVAESLEGDALLLGEVKWGTRTDLRVVRAHLRASAQQLPQTRGKRIVLGCWVKQGGRRRVSDLRVVGPDEVLRALR